MYLCILSISVMRDDEGMTGGSQEIVPRRIGAPIYPA